MTTADRRDPRSLDRTAWPPGRPALAFSA